ncbi:Opi1-domain-containing protein [Polychaeton citri CBS 116435]|uniref:Opi1-domain-containing protein n=1 Tax=Polychaeton citri CBS 116435 TaxID=1314669 RepID=A0A9P4QAL7_9PEZI|nr:Opi1-domain-containing protein [Polychaeton citri CBS 116435]
MEPLQKERPPSYYVSTNPHHLQLPSVPKGDVGFQIHQTEITLPDLRTVLSPDFNQTSPLQHGLPAPIGSPLSTRSLPRLDAAAYQNGAFGAAYNGFDTAIKSPSDTGSAMSLDESNARSSSVSIDDPDVRIAAEALSGLGNPDFIHSPTRQATNHMPSHASPTINARAAPTSNISPQQDPEPLFELLAQAHPWVHGTINGSLSAYATTKNYSPRFVQYGARLVERGITIPVASVGRMTGVEDGLRRYLGGNAHPSHDLEMGSAGSKKRRRLTDEDLDDHTMGGLITPRASRSDSQDSRVEPLPAYGSSKPPSYREASSPPATERFRQYDQPSDDQRSWSSHMAGQVLVVTSGLGVALSERSRQSLSFCLTLLAHSAQHVTNVMEALKLVLEEYDHGREAWQPATERDSKTPTAAVTQENADATGRPKTPEQNDAARRLAQVIKRHSDDIWSTLRNVVSSISNQAGGALPENARQFVRTQLLSLPQRWRVVSHHENNGGISSETSRGAHRMVEFAKEGLDMMSQVTQIIKATLDSAESWLEMAGRRRRGQHGERRRQSGEKDLEMGETEQDREEQLNRGRRSYEPSQLNEKR